MPVAPKGKKKLQIYRLLRRQRICLFFGYFSQVVKVSGLAVQLNRANVKEQRMLQLCRDFLNIISALEVGIFDFDAYEILAIYCSNSNSQVVECSLRTQAIQITVEEDHQIHTKKPIFFSF